MNKEWAKIGLGTAMALGHLESKAQAPSSFSESIAKFGTMRPFKSAELIIKPQETQEVNQKTLQFFQKLNVKPITEKIGNIQIVSTSQKELESIRKLFTFVSGSLESMKTNETKLGMYYQQVIENARTLSELPTGSFPNLANITIIPLPHHMCITEDYNGNARYYPTDITAIKTKQDCIVSPDGKQIIAGDTMTYPVNATQRGATILASVPDAKKTGVPLHYPLDGKEIKLDNDTFRKLVIAHELLHVILEQGKLVKNDYIKFIQDPNLSEISEESSILEEALIAKATDKLVKSFIAQKNK
jgi:hypothetical protein